MSQYQRTANHNGNWCRVDDGEDNTRDHSLSDPTDSGKTENGDNGTRYPDSL